MKRGNGPIGQGNGNGSDVFCKSVVAVVAAMLALRLCQYIRRLLQVDGV